MVVFDLREEAQLMSWMYVVAPLTVLLVLAAMAPSSVRARYPLALSDDVRPLALFFVALLISMVWYEDYERSQAVVTVERCLNGGCSVVEGRVSDVVPVHKLNEGSRNVPPRYGGSFRVGNEHFSHYPSDFSSYSPANLIRNGEFARVYRLGAVLVLVEKL